LYFFIIKIIFQWSVISAFSSFTCLSYVKFSVMLNLLVLQMKID